MRISGLLPPAPKDKLRTHCRLAGHELSISEIRVYNFTQKLCLRCSEIFEKRWDGFVLASYRAVPIIASDLRDLQ